MCLHVTLSIFVAVSVYVGMDSVLIYIVCPVVGEGAIAFSKARASSSVEELSK